MHEPYVLPMLDALFDLLHLDGLLDDLQNYERFRPHQIHDWTGAVKYDGRTFDSYDDAVAFLFTDQLAQHPDASDDAFEEIIGEFYVSPVEEV